MSCSWDNLYGATVKPLFEDIVKLYNTFSKHYYSCNPNPNHLNLKPLNGMLITIFNKEFTFETTYKSSTQ